MAEWLERHTAEAPEVLRSRVIHFALEAQANTMPDTLARAGQAALRTVLAHPGDRSAALDLLAADALVTLALLAQAETQPNRLEEFATSILQRSLSPQ